MNEGLYKVLKLGRKISEKIYFPRSPLYTGAEFTNQEASDLIRDVVSGPAPAMICRFGANELYCMVTYQNLKQRPRDYIGYLKGEIDSLDWNKPHLNAMHYLAGFFPVTDNMLEKFTHLMLEDIKEVDILGSWCTQERFFNEELVRAKKVRLEDLEPYYHSNPWSEVLQNKKVLVIHPFEESIRNQYLKRRLLFKDERVLPEFELITYKSVQSLAYSEKTFETWFDALDFMKRQIEQLEFDIAIIGCGAYGFPLAAHVKRMGKKAVHLGGATQILFGIKGKRWESFPEIAALMNEHWVRPLPTEVPRGSDMVEGGCYW